LSLNNNLLKQFVITKFLPK